jgi:hypothetical protein
MSSNQASPPIRSYPGSHGRSGATDFDAQALPRLRSSTPSITCLGSRHPRRKGLSGRGRKRRWPAAHQSRRRCAARARRFARWSARLWQRADASRTPPNGPRIPVARWVMHLRVNWSNPGRLHTSPPAKRVSGPESQPARGSPSSPGCQTTWSCPARRLFRRSRPARCSGQWYLLSAATAENTGPNARTRTRAPKQPTSVHMAGPSSADNCGLARDEPTRHAVKLPVHCRRWLASAGSAQCALGSCPVEAQGDVGGASCGRPPGSDHFLARIGMLSASIQALSQGRVSRRVPSLTKSSFS